MYNNKLLPGARNTKAHQLAARKIAAEGVERPTKELKGFDKVFLAPGESKKISIELTQRDLSFWDVKTNDWLAETGEFEVQLGISSDNILLKDTFNYQSQ